MKKIIVLFILLWLGSFWVSFANSSIDKLWNNIKANVSNTIWLKQKFSNIRSKINTKWISDLQKRAIKKVSKESSKIKSNIANSLNSKFSKLELKLNKVSKNLKDKIWSAQLGISKKMKEISNKLSPKIQWLLDLRLKTYFDQIQKKFKWNERQIIEHLSSLQKKIWSLLKKSNISPRLKETLNYISLYLKKSKNAIFSKIIDRIKNNSTNLKQSDISILNFIKNKLSP